MSLPREPVSRVLAAEVRVLQVGSKPVTLSAARQLDHVDALDIIPFGRVRIDPKPAPNLIEVIGSAEGILARSSATYRRAECPGYKTGTTSRGYTGRLPVAVCPRHRDTPVSATSQRHEWTDHDTSAEIYEKWLALPLIVLAGLR
jgi:hypothetical protein